MKITEKIENKLVDLKLWEALVLFFVLVDSKADEATQSPPEGCTGISCSCKAEALVEPRSSSSSRSQALVELSMSSSKLIKVEAGFCCI